MKLALAFVLLLAFAPVATRADEAATLLAKHAAFVGWKLGDGSVAALDLQREVIDGGRVIQRAHELRIGMLYRRDYTLQDGDPDSTGFTGHVFWETSGNDFTIPFLGDDARYYRAVDLLFSEATSGLPATVVGSATIAGKAVTIVRVTASDAFPVDLYVDPGTGAYLRATIERPGATGTYDNLSYLDLAPGKKYIGSWTIDGANGVYRYTKTAIVDDMLPERLHPPPPTATWRFANAKPFKISVTPTRFLVDALVNGVPGHFVLDTGASGILLTDAFAARAHVKVISRSDAWGIGGDVKTLIRRADTIVVGGNTLANVTISTYVNPYERNEVASGDSADAVEFDGLLGFDFLAGAVVTLDTTDQTMRIEDPAIAVTPAASGISVLANLVSGVPFVPMVLDRRIPIEALLDTGNGVATLVSYDVGSEDIGMSLGTSRTIRGVGGSETVPCATVASLALGSLAFNSVAACESHALTGAQAIVGFSFLKRFDYVFDYPHSRIIMTPIAP